MRIRTIASMIFFATLTLVAQRAAAQDATEQSEAQGSESAGQGAESGAQNPDDDADGANASEQMREPAIPQVAYNTPAGRFGVSGQLAVSSDAGISISNTSQSGRGGSTTTLILRPAIDYFVTDNLSLGGFLGLEYMKVPDGNSTTFAIGPRIGYNIPFSPRFSIWPKAGLSFAHTSLSLDSTDPALADASTSSTSIALNLFAPIMLHPAEHFFIGFGPALDTDLSGDIKTTTIAGRLTLGGWL